MSDTIPYAEMCKLERGSMNCTRRHGHTGMCRDLYGSEFVGGRVESMDSYLNRRDNGATVRTDQYGDVMRHSGVLTTVRYIVTSQYRPEVRDDMYGLRDTVTGEQMCGNIWDRDNMIELAVRLNSVA